MTSQTVPAPTEKGDGVVVVPREPTEAMLRAGRDAAQSAGAHSVPWTREARAVWSAMIAATQQATGEGVSFQDRVLPWLMECFGAEIAGDRVERCDRFIEEALELAQSLAWPKERALALVEYVYGRPAGEPHQEVGGVMVTLAALCQAAGLDMHAGGDDELARIMRPQIVEKIRAKQAAKPTGSALPIATQQAVSPPEGVGETVAERAIRHLSRLVRVYGDMQDGNGNTPTEIRHAERFLESFGSSLRDTHRNAADGGSSNEGGSQ